MVADLRAAAGRYPEDTELQALLQDLSRTCPRFRQLWTAHAVTAHTQDSKTITHPDIGPIALDCDVLTSERGDLRVVVYTAALGTGAASQLQLLSVLGPQAVTRP
jgi:hypothetical protein